MHFGLVQSFCEHGEHSNSFRTITELEWSGCQRMYSPGPKIATIGVLAAAAKCIGPESLQRKRLHLLIRAVRESKSTPFTMLALRPRVESTEVNFRVMSKWPGGSKKRICILCFSASSQATVANRSIGHRRSGDKAPG